jgi:microcystin degradation protein MlrC
VKNFRFGPVTGPLDDMLDIAEKAQTRPVILADSADNPTGGGVGDRADVLNALIARGFDGALIAGITDRRPSRPALPPARAPPCRSPSVAVSIRPASQRRSRPRC